ncbi:hypothetical protein [Sphingomonas corticis]|uniref:PH domain-containing protein n=1 Tax=Sphingomonas corticis TaxID=2722791 RepID=A0ABX1CH73_9SPHN|nr:hypothetical protein [Sphingomonas corticis]NJR77359.1 hypothetical protein [Sphingomonas corticis]
MAGLVGGSTGLRRPSRFATRRAAGVTMTGGRRHLRSARRLMAKAGVAGGALVLALLVAMAWLTVTAEGPAWIGRRRGGLVVPTLYVQVPLLALLVPCIVVAAAGLVANLRRLLSDRAEVSVAAGLALGEPVRWRGRRGLHAIGAGRLLALAGVGAVMMVFGLLTTRLWTGDGMLGEKLLFSFALLFVFGGVLFFAATVGASALAEWARDVAGTLVVTDRRIAWLHPLRAEVYRAIDADAIVDVTLVENGEDHRSRRGWVAVTVRKGTSNVEAVDLTGLPDAAGAATAMRRLIAS